MQPEEINFPLGKIVKYLQPVCLNSTTSPLLVLTTQVSHHLHHVYTSYMLYLVSKPFTERTLEFLIELNDPMRHLSFGNYADCRRISNQVLCCLAQMIFGELWV